MKINDLDHLEPISDDVAVFGGRGTDSSVSNSVAISFRISGNGVITVNGVSTVRGNTITPSTGVGTSIWTQRLNFTKTLAALAKPTVFKGFVKIATDVSSVLKSRLLAAKRFIDAR
ncbi:hypothetical protein H6G33_29315 [Calothrix sp. FACHB-1219]|uniref:hypothetical protein n=1 Tax=unclassified Calothrix TaxID=2619626 RepID=UPI00168313DA|nr:MULTISPECIES: hypothetical protein [unclassified Calothrix]MBD2206299.1 hypothetical protein [Calothrix sp. FACHB-168]MBD2221081.1 hypothetical protein [Calothrix sp. FACHB-1219]